MCNKRKRTKQRFPRRKRWTKEKRIQLPFSQSGMDHRYKTKSKRLQLKLASSYCNKTLLLNFHSIYEQKHFSHGVESFQTRVNCFIRAPISWRKLTYKGRQTVFENFLKKYPPKTIGHSHHRHHK